MQTKISTMKKLLYALIGLTLAFSLTGCGAVNPYFGGLYTNVTTPTTDLEVQSDSNAGNEKVGEVGCTSILGLIAIGDCSVKAAMEAGDLQQIHHVDQNYTQILGLYSKMTIKAYGE